jgi:8-oxo-dGTP diphosphatase
MKHIGDVVCAIIEKKGDFLLAQRPLGHPLENTWEFPGGKVADGESPQAAIKREIFEELHVTIEICEALTPNDHVYEHLTLTLIPFRCALIEGIPESVEHSKLAWVNLETVADYQLSGADVPVFEEYKTLRISRTL